MAGHREVTANVAFAFGSGCSAGMRDAAAFFGNESGHRLLHPVGRYVMLRHTDGNEVNFLVSDAAVESVTASAVSRDRIFLAVGEKRRATPTRRISVFDLQAGPSARPVASLDPTGLPSAARVVGLAFSADGMLMVALSSAPEPTALVLDWKQESRVVARCKLELPADRIQISPQPLVAGEQVALLCSISGPRTMRLLQLRDYTSKIRESSLKLLPGFSGMAEVKITDHSWVEPGDGTLVASVSGGVIYILSSQDLAVVRAIDAPFGKARGHANASALCIRCFSQGFIVGGTDGMLAIWEKADQPMPDTEETGELAPKEFRHAGTQRVQISGRADPLCCLDLPGTEESLLIGFQSGSLALVQILSLYSSKTGVFDCTALSGGFHGGPITGLDMAVQRPLVVSLCKQDHSLRVWNYITKSCEIRWTFADDPPEAVAVHAFGYFMALSFREKLRFYYILDTGIQLQSEWEVFGIKLLRFSNGGHLIAASQGKLVHIFSTRTYSEVATLSVSGHNVQALCFDAEDHSLWTCGDDGTLYQWDTLSWAKVDEHKTQGLQYSSASSSIIGGLCCSAQQGNEWCLRRFTGCAIDQELVAAGAQLNAICTFPGSSTILGGTNAGNLRICPPHATPDKVREVGLHAGPCTSLLLSADGRTLVTGGEDGAIFLLNVSGLARTEGSEHVGDVDRMGSDVVLVNRAAILQRQAECERLRAETEMLKAKLEAESIRLTEACRRRVEEARAQDRAEIAELGRRCGALEQAAYAKDRESQRIMQSMEDTHSQAYGQLSHLFDKKIEHEADRYEILERSCSQLEAEIEKTRQDTERQLAKEKEEFEEELAKAVAEKDFELQKHKDLIAFAQHRFDQLLQATGQEHDEEVIKKKLRSRAVVEEQKQIEVQLKKEQDTLQKGFELMTHEKASLEKEQQDSAVVIRNMQEQIEDCKGSLNSLKHESRDRESTLRDKEQKIDNYKQKVNKLKKFKHLLDKQLAEVTESLRPKEQLIEQLRKTLEELQREFEAQMGDRRTMESEIKQRENGLTVAGRELQQLQETIKQKESVISHYSNDLHTLITEQADELTWPKEIRRLYHTHVCGLGPSEERTHVDRMQLQMRQAERSVTGLAIKGRQQRSICKAEIQKKSNENAVLVHEVNQLRVHKRSLQTAIKSCTIKLEEFLSAEASMQAASIEDKPRPRSEEAPGTPTARPPGSASSSSLPRTPSGSLPGPRQQSSSDLALLEVRQVRTRSVPPMGASKRRNIPLSFEDQKRVQSLVATADSHARQLRAQTAENKELRGEIDALLKERQSQPSRG